MAGTPMIFKKIIVISNYSSKKCKTIDSNEVCKISEEGPRPGCFARIYNEETRNRVRTTRVENEMRREELEDARRKQKLARQQREQEREAQIKGLSQRQQYLKGLKGQLEFEQTRLRAELVELDRNNRLLAQIRAGRRSFFRIAILRKIVDLESAIAERES
jgi:hypothetical protein